MKSLFVFSALVCVALGDVSHLLRGKPQQPLPHHGGQEIRILSYSNDVNPDGTYNYAYDTENGIHGDEQGSEHGAQGSFSFTSPEGEQVHLTYNADENGFQPQGSHIPTPPPVPESILRALEWIRTHPEPETHAPNRRF